MRIATTAGTAPANTTADAIEWLFYELRGPATAHGSWEQTTLEFWPGGEGQQATLTDGRMTFDGDPGTVERWYFSDPSLLRDGVDGEQAADQARAGALQLATILEAATARGLEQYRIPNGTRAPRSPDQVDLWIRRESGERARYIVPVLLPGGRPGPLQDAIVAASSFAGTLRRNWDEQDAARRTLA